MPGYSLPLTESRIIADLMKRQHGFSAAIGGGPAQVKGFRDRWPISNASTTVYTLTYVPVEWLVWVFLNGVALDEGYDYNIDYSTGAVTLTSTATRAVGDVLSARYVTTDSTAAPATPGAPRTWGIRSNAARMIQSVDAVALIDSGVSFSDISADLVTGTATQTCLILASQNTQPAGADNTYLFLLVTSTSSDLYRFTRTGGVDSDTFVNSFGAVGGSGTYAITRSGATLTLTKGGTTVGAVTVSGSDLTLLDQTVVGMRGDHAGNPTFDNFSANGGAVSDNFNRSDADQLGTAPTGQTWVETS